MNEKLRVGSGGWTLYQEAGLPADVYVRWTERHGRLSPVELYVAGDLLLSAAMLRKVPLGRLEAWVNASDDVQWRIRGRLVEPAIDMRSLASNFATAFPVPSAAPLKRHPRPKAVEPPEVNAKLDVPGQRFKSDDFYREVAAVYTALAGVDRAPAGRIADANNVPAARAHQWIKEARRRQFLPAGTRGKAG